MDLNTSMLDSSKAPVKSSGGAMAWPPRENANLKGWNSCTTNLYSFRSCLLASHDQRNKSGSYAIPSNGRGWYVVGPVRFATDIREPKARTTSFLSNQDVGEDPYRDKP